MENNKLTEEVAITLGDNELVKHSRRGSEVAITTLLTRYKGMILKVSRKYFIDRGIDNDDLVQESTLAFLKAIQHHDPDKGTAFSTFAYQCMFNRLKDILKSHHSFSNEMFNTSQSLTELSGQETERIANDDVTDPLTQAIHNESVENILNIAKEELTKKQYDVLMLFLDGYSYADIQAKLGLANTKQVDNALSAARRTLRELLNV